MSISCLGSPGTFNNTMKDWDKHPSTSQRSSPCAEALAFKHQLLEILLVHLLKSNVSHENDASRQSSQGNSGVSPVCTLLKTAKVSKSLGCLKALKLADSHKEHPESVRESLHLLELLHAGQVSVHAAFRLLREKTFSTVPKWVF